MSTELKTLTTGNFVGNTNSISVKSTTSADIRPIGTIQAWHADAAGTPALPDGWVECNGQTLSDSRSPFDGETIPDLNGATEAARLFLRSNTTSGGTGGAATHGHNITTHDLFSSSASDPQLGYATSVASSANIPLVTSFTMIMKVIAG